jgi:hypothetical protein
LTPGFLEFIKFLDGVLKEMQAKGELAPHIHLQALRSGLMGAIEGLLRDQYLARATRYPATFSEADSRVIFSTILAAFLNK